MKKNQLGLGMVVSLCSATALAQGFRLGADAASVVPIGNYSTNNRVGIGGLIRMEAISPSGIVFTFRTGYIRHLTKIGQDELSTNFKFDEIPVLIGTRFYTVGRLYAALEAGVTSTSLTTSTSNTLGSTSDYSLTASAAVGLGVLIGPFDLQANVRSVDLWHLKNTVEYGGTLGFFINL